jgi:DEAD/DEAH box helicase domain-containing protein
VLNETLKMITRCQCQSGCPSCIGMDTVSETSKNDAIKIIESFLQPSHTGKEV